MYHSKLITITIVSFTSSKSAFHSPNANSVAFGSRSNSPFMYLHHNMDAASRLRRVLPTVQNIRQCRQKYNYIYIIRG